MSTWCGDRSKTLFSLLTLLADLIQVLSNQKTNPNLSGEVDCCIAQLLEYLRNFRCLLILDNVEALLHSGDSAGCYRKGYEGYNELFQRVGQTQHQSCLLLTSREKPRELTILKGETSPVRCFKLAGIKVAQGQAIFQSRGDFSGSEDDWRTVVEHYGGNPLALKMVAAGVDYFLDGSLTRLVALLDRGTLMFGDIRILLEQQFQRLSDLERQVMYWLAVNREVVSLEELQADLVPKLSLSTLIEQVSALERRSLIEKTTLVEKSVKSKLRQPMGFTQQPVVMEYVTERLIKKVFIELSDRNLASFSILNYCALLKATAKDYVRESQIRVILKPLADKLQTAFGTKKEIERQLKSVLVSLQAESASNYYGCGNLVNLLHQLKIDLKGYDFSGLKVWQAYLPKVSLQQVNFAEADLSKSVFTETIGSIFSISFSPDGQFLAFNSSSEILVYRVADNKQILTCRGHTFWVWCVTFSPNSQMLATSSQNGTIKLWNIRTGKCLQTWQEDTIDIWSVAFSPDGSLLACATSAATVHIRDLRTGKRLRTLSATGGSLLLCSAIFSSQGDLLATCCGDTTIRLWSTKTWECLQVLEEPNNIIDSIAISPDGRLLASGGFDKTIKVWEVSPGRCLQTLIGHCDRLFAVAFSLVDACYILASGDEKGLIKLWNCRTGECFRNLSRHTSIVYSLAFHPNGQLLASGGQDYSLRLWDVSTGQALKTFRGEVYEVLSVAFSPDGRVLASSSQDRAIGLWNVASGECTQSLYGHQSSVWSVVFSPVGDSQSSKFGQTLVSYSTDTTAKFWDLSSRQCYRTLPVSSGPQWGAFSPDGRVWATGDEQYVVRLWHISSGEVLRSLEGHTNWVFSLDFSSDGQLLASGSADQTVRV